MGNYRAGAKVRFVKHVQRSTGAGWPGDTGRIHEVTGDGYRIRKDADGVHLDNVKDNEIEPA